MYVVVLIKKKKLFKAFCGVIKKLITSFKIIIVIIIIIATIIIIIHYYYYDGTNVWMLRVKNKSYGWAANRKQTQHRLKFLVTITQ